MENLEQFGLDRTTTYLNPTNILMVKATRLAMITVPIGHNDASEVRVYSLMSSTVVLPTIQINVNYSDIQKQVADFFRSFKSSNADLATGAKYLDLLQSIANREADTLIVDLDDLKLHHDNLFHAQAPAQSLVAQVQRNTHHYIELFSKVADALMPPPTVDVSYKDDVLDVILHQRELRNARVAQENEEELSSLRSSLGDLAPADGLLAENLFPPQLTRRYSLYFAPLLGDKALAVRDVKGSHVGKYITVRGIVTRVLDVKPSLLVNAYTCDKCGYEVFQEVRSKVFQPLTECTSQVCKNDNQRGQLFMLTRASKFLAFQEAKVQEMASQVPVGHIPRMLTVHVNGALVRSMLPGDVVDVSGVVLPLPYTGFRALKAGLLTETFLETQHVRQHKKQYELLELTEEMQARITALHRAGGAYARLAESIAPEIYGHLDVKKVLLLLLCGGVQKDMGDGMRIRGDINVCLMGDPGVAKSQLLKAISKLAPRAVYTTGRGSSGVGLTAAVMRDAVTDEMVLEGGALVLADNGICCIDEFDKMEEGDRTAIHEVMEQQTISISKAGINTTLNARASILAAANPLYGRYNPRLSPHENINLPAALLLRFDVMFLMLDQASEHLDEQLAQHVTYVHMHNRQPDTFEPVDAATVRQYIAVARTYRPVVPRDVGDYVVQEYIKMRREAHFNEDLLRNFGHVTPRTLLAVLRLSQALARIRFDNSVTRSDVDEALRLMAVLKMSMDLAPEERVDQTSQIVNHIRAMAEGSAIAMAELRLRLIAKGFTAEQVADCLQTYADLGLFQVTDDGETLLVVNQA